MNDTIFALSSGRPPAAIAVLRISGPRARTVGDTLAGALPAPRVAAVRRLRDGSGETLDQALTLFFPGPGTATGEDLLELHLHGGRAVVAAVEAVLARQPGVRLAEPGEFTRRALGNGRLDLAQAEGLADLLEAETDAQRRAALALAEGGLSQLVVDWLDHLSMVAARIEAEIDFGEEDDVAHAAPFDVSALVAPMLADIRDVLARPSVERLRDGVVVVLAGPRNAGKSSLFNALLGREAAIVTDIAGTTRDVLEAAVVRDGMPFRLVDTAGLVDATADPVEAIGIARARAAFDTADVLLWLGSPDDAPPRALRIGARADERDLSHQQRDHLTSIHDRHSIDTLWNRLSDIARSLLGDGGSVLPRLRHRTLMEMALRELSLVSGGDLLLEAERLRIASAALAEIVGRNATEAMLDALFGRFCLGK